MTKLFAKVRRKFLLGVFKLRRTVNRWYGTRRLDYPERDIFITTDTIREYETRARSVRKEPKTVAWIEKHGGPGTVLYDVGANIGAYGLIAAARGASVVAFEPAHQNIYKLHENILLNGLADRMIVVPLILAGRDGLTTSFVEKRTFGATHSFSTHETPSESAAIGQTFLTLRLDECVRIFALPAPTMIKIDVDGAEIEVLEGAKQSLANPELATLLIETDHRYTEAVRRLCADAGLRLVGEERFGNEASNYIFERR